MPRSARSAQRPIVRAATEADLETLVTLVRETDRLHARLQPGFFHTDTPEAALRRELERPLGRSPEAMLVAEAQGTVVGLIRTSLYETPPLPALVARRRAHIDQIVVAPGARGAGIGRELLEAATRWARAHGAEQILLTVWEGNTAAFGFYERLGFERVSAVLAKEL